MFETKNDEIVYRTKNEILDTANHCAKRSRPGKLGASTTRSIRISDHVWDKLTKPRAESARNAIDKFLSDMLRPLPIPLLGMLQ